MNGNLSTITRGGYLDLAHSDGKKYNQIYGFEYDKFGNRTKVTLKGEVVNKSSGAVESTSGTSTLATYTYQANNGPLTSMTYGPSTGTKVTYTYDALERVARDVEYFAKQEGLTAHAKSAVIRLEGTDNGSDK